MYNTVRLTRIDTNITKARKTFTFFYGTFVKHYDFTDMRTREILKSIRNQNDRSFSGIVAIFLQYCSIWKLDRSISNVVFIRTYLATIEQFVYNTFLKEVPTNVCINSSKGIIQQNYVRSVVNCAC